MPKLKTHKGMKKRFKVSANGKVQHKRCGSSHLMSHKNGKQVRRLRKPSTLNVAAESRRVRFALHIRPAVNPLEVEAARQAALAAKAETSTGSRRWPRAVARVTLSVLWPPLLPDQPAQSPGRCSPCGALPSSIIQ